MAHPDALAVEITNSESDSGVRFKGSVHPLLAAIENAPLDPISDEENAQLDEIRRSTTQWLTDENFQAAVGSHLSLG